MKRPKFHPVYDDYYVTWTEDGEVLEFASTDQFWELFEYADQCEQQIKELKELNHDITNKSDWYAENKDLKQQIKELEELLKNACCVDMTDSKFNDDWYKRKEQALKK